MKALIVYKKSQYQIYVNEKQNGHIKDLISSGSEVTKGLLKAHEEHERNLEAVTKTVEKHFSSVRSRYRGSLDMIKDADVVFTAGGDGTLLCAQKYIPSGLPVIGINTDTDRSVGALLATTTKDLDSYIVSFLEKKKEPRIVTRMQVSVNNEVVRSRVLNDVLFCHSHPAGMSAFLIKQDNKAELVKSSGMWVSTPVGSTGAIKAAGGVVLYPLAKTLEYFIREPYVCPVNQSGFVASGASLEVVSKMRESLLSFDGSRDNINLQMGDVVKFTVSPETLFLY